MIRRERKGEVAARIVLKLRENRNRAASRGRKKKCGRGRERVCVHADGKTGGKRSKEGKKDEKREGEWGAL